MSRMISITDFCEIYDIDDGNLHVKASIYAKKNGSHPDWYMSDGISVKIDQDAYFKWPILHKKIWNYATEKLYWIFRDLGFGDNDIAKKMAARSRFYKSVQSWYIFFNLDLFAIRSDNQRPPDTPPMLVEFVRHGTRLLYDMRNTIARKHNIEGTK